MVHARGFGPRLTLGGESTPTPIPTPTPTPIGTRTLRRTSRRGRRVVRRVTILLITILACYLLACAALFFFQERLLFPGVGRVPPVGFQWPEAVEILQLQAADGTSFRVADAMPFRRQGAAEAGGGAPQVRGVLVYFVGNGEDLTSGASWAAMFAEYGLRTIVAEYPGYGQSEGAAGFRSILAAAEATGRRAQAAAAAAGVPLFVGGHSLGTFSAVHLAADGVGDRLLLASPPTSIREAARQRFPFLPIRWLLRHPFDNLGRAADVTAPTLILHGAIDQIVPLDMGRRLAEAIDGATLIVARGHGHNNLDLSRRGPFATAIEAHLFGKR